MWMLARSASKQCTLHCCTEFKDSGARMDKHMLIAATAYDDVPPHMMTSLKERSKSALDTMEITNGVIP